MSWSRRRFLGATATAALSDGMALFPWREARAEKIGVIPEMVRFQVETEPLLQLIEETPREQCVPVMMKQFRRGLPYNQFLAALYLAAVRAAPYHGRVHGFDHNAYSIYSAQQLSLWLPPQEAMLPGFWALDSLKGARFGLAKLPISIKGGLPRADRAARELQNGIENCDEERAVAAVIAMVRSRGAQQVGDWLWPYAGRDWFFIGHLAILVANSWRLLQTIGWQHAEPVLQYVVSGLSGMKRQDSELDGFAENRQRAFNIAGKLPPDWAAAEANPGLTRELLVLLRARKSAEACQLTATALAKGKVKTAAAWDAVFLAAGEMVMCAQKSAEPLHANTAINALRFAFEVSRDAKTRLLLLLQALNWCCRFRGQMVRKDWLKDPKDITALSLADQSIPSAAPDEILAPLSHGGRDHGPSNRSPVPGWHGGAYNHQPWRYEAARQAFAFARAHPQSDELFRSAARLLPAKADGDPHRIKFPVAMFENCRWISPEWRAHLEAAASYSFLGADAPDTDLIRQVREAAKLPG